MTSVRMVTTAGEEVGTTEVSGGTPVVPRIGEHAELTAPSGVARFIVVDVVHEWRFGQSQGQQIRVVLSRL